MRDWMREACFRFRKKHGGRLALRQGLPGIRSQKNPDELKFYAKVLGCFPIGAPDVVCDVGCRNWSYAAALREKFPAAKLVGFELDAFRRYWNLWRRVDYARAHAKASEGRNGAPGAHVFPEGFSPEAASRFLTEGQRALFTLFFPFVSIDPCRDWGLPPRFADYGELVGKVLLAARQPRLAGAALLSCHQGEWEAEIAAAAYARCGLAAVPRALPAEETKAFWPSPHGTFVFSVPIL